jgi:hypothetical protein
MKGSGTVAKHIPGLASNIGRARHPRPHAGSRSQSSIPLDPRGKHPFMINSIFCEATAKAAR